MFYFTFVAYIPDSLVFIHGVVDLTALDVIKAEFFTAFMASGNRIAVMRNFFTDFAFTPFVIS
jgi:hypothetical protein